MFPLVKFVEAPDPAAAVRYDCNRAGEDGVAARLVMAEGFTLGVPTLQGDPDAIGVTYGFRQPYFVQRVKGTKAEALAALEALSRELLRQTNWVLFELDSWTAPIWLKTYWSEFGALSLREVYVKTRTGDPVLMPDTWEIPVPLVADAFGYRERVTHPAVTVTQTPDGTNPMRIVLPAIKGDAPTPLRISITPATGQEVGSGASSWLIGCVAGETTMGDPVVEIGTGDGFTAGTGTAAGTADAADFGGSGRTVTIAADDVTSGDNYARRITGNLPVIPLGRYKVQLRCMLTTAGPDRDFLFAFGQPTNGGFTVYRYGSTAVIPHGSTSEWVGWVDLGEFTFPMGVTVPRDVAGAPDTYPFTLKIGTADNAAGTVRVDALKLIPVDGRTVTATNLLKTSFPADAINPLAGDVVGNFDGDDEVYWSTDTSDLFLYVTPTMAGGFPAADPAAAQNLLIVMATDHGGPGAATTAVTTELGAEADVVVSYHPRVLHLGDGT